MEIPNFKSWKTAFLLSIIVPVSLLATFKLTGIIKEPLAPETIQLSPVRWEFPRPDGDVRINHTLKATHVIEGVSVDMYVILGVYLHESISHNNLDYLTIGMGINLTATNPNCFIDNIYITFNRDSQPSFMDWLYTYFNFENLSIQGVSGSYQGAYVRLAGVNHPNVAYFKATAEWSLLTTNNQTHQTELTYEITYYNGTVYKKLIQPFDLKLTGKGS